MGANDSKAIMKHIDSKFKSIRKYHDIVYGEITLLQQKQSMKMFALIQKVVFDQEELNNINSWLLKRKQKFSQFLMPLHSSHSFKLDYCSNAEKYYFLVEYSDLTLYQQMALRLENSNPFSIEELQKILLSFTEISLLLKQSGQQNFIVLSNHTIIYEDITGKTKTIEPLLTSNEFQRFLYEYQHPQNNKIIEQNYFIYCSPEVFSFYCNRQFLRARTMAKKQQSVVFTMGMNILQCALLANLQGVYDFKEKRVRFDKLDIAIKKMTELYGQQLAEQIKKMVGENHTERPTLLQIKKLTQIHPKRRKIPLLRYINIIEHNQQGID